MTTQVLPVYEDSCVHAPQMLDMLDMLIATHLDCNIVFTNNVTWLNQACVCACSPHGPHVP